MDHVTYDIMCLLCTAASNCSSLWELLVILRALFLHRYTPVWTSTVLFHSLVIFTR